MRIGPRAQCRRSTAVLALLLLAALSLCLVHVDMPGADDMCAGFGPPTRPVALPALTLLGALQVAPVTVYQPVPADLSAPPPEV